MKNKILVYDDNCPLCTWYSGLFVKYGFLNADGRKPFSTLDEKLLAKIDFDKSRNEIPLLDTSTYKVVYGIDALLEILDQKIPCIKATGNFGPLKWVLKKIYKLVSFNRKVIVAKKCGHVSPYFSHDGDSHPQNTSNDTLWRLRYFNDRPVTCRPETYKNAAQI